mmetsp:Transcript_7635/g.18667  ORF Transcript_7635/g.18667 Transcript_7635/m.18667 type:complete len:325 (+) Transcript_7635:1034-2008(+)
MSQQQAIGLSTLRVDLLGLVVHLAVHGGGEVCLELFDERERAPVGLLHVGDGLDGRPGEVGVLVSYPVQSLLHAGTLIVFRFLDFPGLQLCQLSVECGEVLQLLEPPSPVLVVPLAHGTERRVPVLQHPLILRSPRLLVRLFHGELLCSVLFDHLSLQAGLLLFGHEFGVLLGLELCCLPLSSCLVSLMNGLQQSGLFVDHPLPGGQLGVEDLLGPLLHLLLHLLLPLGPAGDGGVLLGLHLTLALLELLKVLVGLDRLFQGFLRHLAALDLGGALGDDVLLGLLLEHLALEDLILDLLQTPALHFFQLLGALLLCLGHLLLPL